MLQLNTVVRIIIFALLQKIQLMIAYFIAAYYQVSADHMTKVLLCLRVML